MQYVAFPFMQLRHSLNERDSAPTVDSTHRHLWVHQYTLQTKSESLTAGEIVGLVQGVDRLYLGQSHI
jgi:hypothetical protein